MTLKEADMGQTFRDALLRRLESSGRSLLWVANQADVSYEQLKKVRQRPESSTNVDDAQKVAAAFGMTLTEFLTDASAPTPTLAVAGYVGAGARVPMADPYEKGGGLYHIRQPRHLPGEKWVAVEVRGDSMEPAYQNGDVLIYRRDAVGVPAEAIGARCVCEDAEGNVWIKRVRRREGQPEGLFDLLSFHADTPPMYDVALRWAVPIKMHLQSDYVERVD